MKRIADVALASVLGWVLAQMHLAQADRAIYYTGALLNDTQYRPFVYRQLTPWLIRTLDALTGVGLDPAAVWVEYLACVAWLLALLYLGRAVLTGPGAVLAVLAAPLLIWPFLLRMYMTDMPSLALMTLGLGLLARHQWRAYLLLFPLGVLCHEVFALLGVVYWLQARPQIAPRQFYAALAYQLGTLGLIKLFLAWRFAANPGAVVTFNAGAHYYYLMLYPAAHVIVLVVFGLAVGALLWRYPTLPSALQPAVTLVPLYFFAYLFLGFPGELRAIIGVYPVLLILLFVFIGQLAQALARRLAVLRGAGGVVVG